MVSKLGYAIAGIWLAIIFALVAVSGYAYSELFHASVVGPAIAWALTFVATGFFSVLLAIGFYFVVLSG